MTQYEEGYEMGEYAAKMGYPEPNDNVINQYTKGFIQGYYDYKKR